MDQPAESFPCMLLGSGGGVLRLRCAAPFAARGISAWLNGVEIGHLPLPMPANPGEDLHLALGRLPRVPLPAELRLGTADRDLAAPIPLATAQDAEALVGPGLWRAEDLALRHGVLHGALVNADNGLAEPRSFARINGSLARPLLLGQPATLADGGALWPFQLTLQAEDLGEAGLTVALHVAAQDAPLATLAWGRQGPEALAERLVALETRLEEATQAQAASLAQLAAEQRRAQLEQRDRIDAFIEYAGALLLDRLAGTAAAATAPDALRALISAAAPLPLLAAEAMPAGGMVLPGSAGFSFGWHQLERDAGGEFRWMGAAAAVSNPNQARAVAAVLAHLRHIHGAEGPALTATLDGAAAATTLEGEGPSAWRLRVTPAGPAPCRTLRLASAHHASPAELGTSADTRPLSVAVSRVEFLFAD